MCRKLFMRKPNTYTESHIGRICYPPTLAALDLWRRLHSFTTMINCRKAPDKD